jgi:hypothetical protein
VAYLAAKKEISAQVMLFQPLANSSPAVGLTALAVQVNTIAAQAVVFLETSLVGVRLSRGGAGHDIAQWTPERRNVESAERHEQQ